MAVNVQTIEKKMNFELGYIIGVIFAIPLFVAMPEWYHTLEFICGLILISFAGFSAGFLCRSIRNPRTVTYSDEVYKGFLRKERVIFWGVVAVILYSMFVQDMINMFSVYLILTLASNVMQYMIEKRK